MGKCSVGGVARGFFPLVECATPAVHSLWETPSIVPTKQAVRQSTENSNALCIRVNTRQAVEAGRAAHKSIKNEKQSDSYVCLLPAVLCRRGHCLRFTNNLCVAMSMSPAMPGVDYPVACTNRARVGWPVAPTPQNYYPFSVTGVAPVSLREPVTDTNPLRATPLRDSRTTITRPPRPSGRAGRRRKKAPPRRSETGPR